MARRLIVKVLQTFEFVWGPCRPRISILGLIALSTISTLTDSMGFLNTCTHQLNPEKKSWQ